MASHHLSAAGYGRITEAKYAPPAKSGFHRRFTVGYNESWQLTAASITTILGDAGTRRTLPPTTQPKALQTEAIKKGCM